MKPYYDNDQITIYHGSADDVLPQLPAESIDLIFTSPPYNLGNTTGGGMPGKKIGHYSATAPLAKRGGMGKWSGGALANGYEAFDDNMPHVGYVAWQHSLLRECWRVLGPAGAIYYNHKPRVLDGVLVEPREYVPAELPVRQRIIWARAGGINFSPVFYLPTYEEILLICKPAFRLKSKGASGVGDVWYVPQEANPNHPAPFPLALPQRALETTTAQTILDPFCGSGTTLRAAKNAGRRAIGIELSERYCDLAARNLSQEVLDLFGSEAA